MLIKFKNKLTLCQKYELTFGKICLCFCACGKMIYFFVEMLTFERLRQDKFISAEMPTFERLRQNRLFLPRCQPSSACSKIVYFFAESLIFRRSTILYFFAVKLIV
jgi:hypothetical protein